jgi:hypothetical protein
MEMENEKVHIFERAGLGKAPFKFAGMIEQDICYGEVILNRAEYEKTGIRMSTKPGGSCDYCGTYIINMFRIKSADAKEFKVGCECVLKTGDAGLVKPVKKMVAERNKARKAARDKAKLEKALQVLPSVADKLKAKPHQQEWRAKKGETLYDMVDWYLKNAGMTGKLWVSAIILKEAAPPASEEPGQP